MPLPSGNKCYDVMQCPVRVKLPTDAGLHPFSLAVLPFTMTLPPL